MVRGVAETSESSTRRWSGYVCPDCRFVFRVPRDHDGTGLVCPSCRRMLRLPSPGEILPPLIAPEQEAPHIAEPMAHPRERGRRRREQPSWEEDGRKRSSNSDRLVIGGVAVAMLALTAGTLLLLKSKPGSPPQPGVPRAEAPAPAVVTPAPTPVPAAPVVDPKALVESLEPLVKTFLTAGKVSEVLPVIGHPETSGPRLMRKWPDGRITPVGFSSFAETGEVTVAGDTAAALVVTGDFKSRLMYFVKTPQGWRIDWESWVDWSAMGWDDFIAKRSIEPVPFRVIATEANYYNFGFTDEKKWRSVRLESVDGQRHLDGYIERESETDKSLRFEDSPKGVHCQVELRFPEGGRADQVIVSRIVSQGWVAPQSKQEP
ncbi:hypothetical protein KBB96_07375 [Luteolibacter ambystomatis]|uniref:Uncharacterized protein n=1 Tax=Luteolibacter ambystomatis TaxID=2824561 RepID=A0A975PGW0_9BACT|nr:hypothetical protein [Luteolibacter ambystomatis]QUE52707.1 hypothetical protein KBB96_07375 [Luteolibacter ambystomatis]